MRHALLILPRLCALAPPGALLGLGAVAAALQPLLGVWFHSVTSELQLPTWGLSLLAIARFAALAAMRRHILPAPRKATPKPSLNTNSTE